MPIIVATCYLPRPCVFSLDDDVVKDHDRVWEIVLEQIENHIKIEWLIERV